MKSKHSFVFTLLVDNEFGVLTRITALIRRAGWNIRSLAVAETDKPEVSRLTICLECRHHTLESVLDRLGRLDCVREISLYSPESQVARELALIRIGSKDTQAVLAACGECDVRVLESQEEYTVLSLVALQSELDALLRTLEQRWTLELARTGTIALPRIK